MKKIKNITLILTFMCCLSFNAAADDTANVNNGYEYAEETESEISISENITAEQGMYSSTPIKVVRYADNQEEVIYTGTLGGYDNGRWSDINIAEMQSFTIIDWSDMSDFNNPESADNAVYIIPLTGSAENTVQTYAARTLSIQTAYPELSIDASYYLNNIEIEDSSTNISGGTSIAAEYVVTNTGNAPQDMQMLICIYNFSDELVNIAAVGGNVSANGSCTLQTSVTAPDNTENYYAKVMLWDGSGSMFPLHEVYRIGTSSQSIENAAKINTDIPLCLSVEQSNDSAWYYLEPKYSGLYTVDISEGFNIELYEKTINGLESVSVNEENYLAYPKKYYLKISPDDSLSGCFTLEISGIESKLKGKAFETNIMNDVYYSNINDSGRLYKNQSIVTNTETMYPVSWLCSFNGCLYFNAGGSLNRLTSNSYETVGSDIDARYLTADDTNIYFSNWSDGGRIYRAALQDNAMVFEKVCNDSASWLEVHGDYLVYKNNLDNNKMYKILKSAQNALTGENID